MMKRKLKVWLMKEIDLLPKWYKNRKRRRTLWHTQYVILGCLFLAMMFCDVWMVHKLSKSQTQADKLYMKIKKVEDTAQDFARFVAEITRLRERSDILNKIDSKINVADVLAEMSFLIDERIVISQVEFSGEKIVEGQMSQMPKKTDGLVFLTDARSPDAAAKSGQVGGVRFKVMISGLAASAGDVAELICKLEDSPYFWLVYPEFSRNTMRKEAARLQGSNFAVSEFRIGCYLANFRYDESSFVKANRKKIL